MKNCIACVTIILAALNLLTGCGDASSRDRAANPNAAEVQRELQVLREELAETRSQARQPGSPRAETASDTDKWHQQWSLSNDRSASQPRSAPTPSYQQAEAPPAKNDSEQMLQVLILQGLAEQQRQQQAQNSQQYQRFQRAAEQARTCQACGGNGSYRFVDASGQLRLQSCPYCQGMGRNW